MLAAAERREFDVILAKTQSRFTRDMELVESTSTANLPSGASASLPWWTTWIPRTAPGKKARQINGLINEWYLEDLSDNVRSVLTHKRWQGDYIATFALYGYRKRPHRPQPPAA